jgi:hypothetical protein
MLFTLSWTSDRTKKRGMVAFFAPMPVVVGYVLVVATSNVGVGYFAMFLCGGGMSLHPNRFIDEADTGN